VLPGESEKQFAAEVIRLGRVFHQRIYFTQHSKGSPPGWPDLVIVKPPFLRIRELKTNEGRLTPIQVETIELLKACTQFDVDIWRPKDWQRIVAEMSA